MVYNSDFFSLLLGEMMLEVFHIVLILLESQVSLIASDITSGKKFLPFGKL